MGWSLPERPDGRQRAVAVAAGLLVLAVGLVAPSVAGARIGVAEDDIRVGVPAMLPAGAHCRVVGVRPVWVPDLRDERGHRIAGGAWPGICEVLLDPAWWATAEPCDRRRLVFHELGHVAARDDEPGTQTIMDPDPPSRELVPVRGCPGPSLTDRVEDRVLDLAPVGWSVICGRSGAVVRCRVESGRRVRRYRGRAAGVGIRVVRV